MHKKIKLIFFHPYSYLGGADNSLRRLIENLDLNKFSITFISLNKSYLKNILINNIEEVGNYAIRIIFSDDHSSGIFSWNLLHDFGKNQKKYIAEYYNSL